MTSPVQPKPRLHSSIVAAVRQDAASAVLPGSLAVQCSLAAGATLCRNSGNCREVLESGSTVVKRASAELEVPLKCLKAESASKVLERAVAGMESASTVLESTILVMVQYWKVPVQCWKVPV